jgi:chromosome segregation protein
LRAPVQKEQALLKLKKLQILGFKSFCDRTELKFHGDGIAAIVGPNGCGKSNIGDAIAWVLGEQSARTLRGTKMEDVIFAGTRDRKATGMAEVSLTLVDPEVYEGAVAADPEIEIQNDMPEDDWDEAALRAEAAQETEEYSAEVQPGQTTEAADGPSLSADGQNPAAKTAPNEDVQNIVELSGSNAPRSTIDHRPSTGVVLKIRRRKFKPAFKAGEIHVTRRLFRSGDSEYLLNGKLCRLRDIQDIFMGTGLGPESYAIIEQGRIGQILSSKPTDRRAIIEEAAGITKFKTKKRLAEARLEEAKLNLNRVNDIFEEVTRQCNSLKRQAAKAERYGRVREEMRGKLRLVLASKLAAMRQEAEELETVLHQLAEDLQAKGEAVRGLETDQAASTQRGYAIEDESRQVRELIAAMTRQADRSASRQHANEERCAELAVRAESAVAEIAQTKAKSEILAGERASYQLAVDSAAGELESAQFEATARQEEAWAASSALAEVEREQEQRRAAIMQAVAETSEVRNRIARAQERISGLERELSRLTRELESGRSQLETFGGQRGQIALEFESASQRGTSLSEQISGTRSVLSQKRTEEIESKKRLDTLRAEFATAIGKKGSLEAVIAEHGYSTESVRRLFQSGALQDGMKPAGVLADFLEVDDRYEHVVEDFLRDELNYVVVKSWDAASEGMRLLRTDVDGRATFLVHPSDSQAKFSFVLDEAAHQAPHRDYEILPLKSTIRVLNGFGKSLEVVLPKLRDGYIVPEANVARDLALENPDAFFLSQSGECFHNVTVTGGKQRAQGPLAMKRELREVMRQMQDIENTLREEERRCFTLGREIQELTGLLERLENEKREADKQAMTSGHALKQLESEVERIGQRVEIAERELRHVEQERAALDAQISEYQAEAAVAEERRAALETESAAAQESLAGLREARDAAARIASEMMARMAGIEERKRAAVTALARLESQIAEVASRLEQLESQRQMAIAENAQRELENLEIAEQLVALAAEREKAEAREHELAAESEQVRARGAALEEELRAARADLDAVRDRRGEIAAQAAKLQSDQQHMAETSVNELGITSDDLLADESIVRVSGEELGAEDTAYHDLRSKLDAMGPVNMMALEEYQEAKQRHDFLETQRKDLLDSIANTQEAIREIETVSRQKFEEAFAKINENFSQTFVKLFGGGQGFMRLTDAENAMESGIDVVASPPGKKLQNVLLLSGGEKALTALALLVGIFQYTPSPFCILDEVDAPLDETNVGRFTELVKEMSERTQFIIVTHSKKTMSAAPVMYGVTMQEPGVSKLVSVRFHEAEPAQQAATA